MRKLYIFVTIGLFIMAYSVTKWIITGKGAWCLSFLAAFFIILKLADIKPIYKPKIQIKFHKHAYMSTRRFIILCVPMMNCIDEIFAIDHNYSKCVHAIKNTKMRTAMKTINQSAGRLYSYNYYDYTIDDNAIKEVKYYIPEIIKLLEYYDHILSNTHFKDLTQPQKDTIDHIEETTITFSKLFEHCTKDVENIITTKYDIDIERINEMMTDYLEDTSHDDN